MKKIKPNKTIRKRLAFIKFLYFQGISNSKRSFPYSSVSLLNFHDSIELFLTLVADETNSKTTDSIKQYFDNIHKAGKGFKLKWKTRVNKLVKLRNNLKHGAIIPTQNQLDEAKESAEKFFKTNTKLVFGISIEDISLIDLIEDDDLREHLNSATKSFSMEDYKDCFKELAYGFWEMIDKVENRKRPRSFSPFYFGKDMTFLNSFHMGLGRNNYSPYNYQSAEVSSQLKGKFSQIDKQFEELGKFVDVVQDALPKMQSAVKILSLGLNYFKFSYFNEFVPHVSRTLNGDYHFSLRRNFEELDINEDIFQFCLDFIIESYFILHENNNLNHNEV